MCFGPKLIRLKYMTHCIHGSVCSQNFYNVTTCTYSLSKSLHFHYKLVLCRPISLKMMIMILAKVSKSSIEYWNSWIEWIKAGSISLNHRMIRFIIIFILILFRTWFIVSELYSVWIVYNILSIWNKILPFWNFKHDFSLLEQ